MKPAATEEFALTPSGSQAIAIQADPMLSFIERASLDPSFDASKLRELMNMRAELKMEAAKEDFEASFAVFKSNLPVIHKTKAVYITKDPNAAPAYYFAPLEEVCDKLIPALNAVGITHKWKATYDGEYMVVTCVLKKGLYSDEGTSMRGIADKSGAKNAIQAEGSTLSYLERYTLCAACGIAIKNADTDASGMDNGAVAEQVEFMQNASSPAELKRLYGVAANLALDKADKKSIAIFKAAKAQKEKEFA